MKPPQEEEEEHPSQPVSPLVLEEAHGHALVLSCSHNAVDQEQGSQVLTKLDCSTNGGRVEAAAEEPSDGIRNEPTQTTVQGPPVLERQTRSPTILEPATGHRGTHPAAEEADEGWCGREKLKKHRKDVAGKVWIPETWGQEQLLKDWIDCSAFDASIMSASSARDALVQQNNISSKSLILGD
ncbi:Protein BIC1 [Linum grandiflorum]